MRYHPVYEALQGQGVPPKLVNFLHQLNKESSNVVVVNGAEVPIEIGRGVRQGDCLSPRLFTAALEEAFRSLNWCEKGIKINGRFLHHILFADDAVLISHDSKQAQRMVDQLIVALRRVGLTLNATKTVAMTNRPRGRGVTIAGQLVRVVNRCVYLGQEVSLESNRFTGEIDRRIRAANFSFNRYRTLFTNRLVPMPIKRRLFQGAILPAIAYASETWSLTRRLENKLNVAQREWERAMLGVSLLDRRTNEWVRRRTRPVDVVRYCREKKWRSVARLARMEHLRWPRAFVEWHPRGPTRRQGCLAMR